MDNERNMTTTTTEGSAFDNDDPWANPFTPSQQYESALSAWTESNLGTGLQHQSENQPEPPVTILPSPSTNINQEHSFHNSIPTPMLHSPPDITNQEQSLHNSTPSINHHSFIPSSSLPTPKQFLTSFQTQAFGLIQNVYVEADRSLSISANNGGTLTTNLAEDLVYLLKMQIIALEEYLVEFEEAASPSSPPFSSKSNGGGDIHDIRSEAITSLLFAMYTRQLVHRDLYLIDVEGCCAAANDFARLAELVEDWAITMDRECHSENKSGLILTKERELPDLVRLYSMDAEYALRLACRFALDTIEEEFVDVGEGICGRRWEEDGLLPSTYEPLDDGTTGEPDAPTAKPGAALTALLNITEEFLNDTEEYLSDEHLYRKVTEATIRGIAVYYVGQLLGRAAKVRQRRRTTVNIGAEQIRHSENVLIPDVPFADPNVAAKRISEDIFALKSFFRAWVLEMPAINQHIDTIFAPVMAMQKCLELAGDISLIGSEGSYDFVAELFDAVNDDLEMTIKLVQDLWGLAMPLGGGGATDIVMPASVKEEICRVANNATCRDEGSTSIDCHVTPRFHVPGLSLRELLITMYCCDDSYCDDLIVVPSPKHLPRLSRKKAVKSLKADFIAARKKLGNVPLPRSLPKNKMKKKAKDFLRTCKEAGKISSRN